MGRLFQNCIKFSFWGPKSLPLHRWGWTLAWKSRLRGKKYKNRSLSNWNTAVRTSRMLPAINMKPYVASTLLLFMAKMLRRFRQQCRTKFRPFDKVETTRTCSICFDFVKRTKFRSTLLPKQQHRCQKWQQCRSNIRIVRLVAFDNVASTLLLAWTGLKRTNVGTRRGSRMNESFADVFEYLKKRYREFSEKLDLLVSVFVVDGDFKDRVNVRHFTDIKTTRLQTLNIQIRLAFEPLFQKGERLLHECIVAKY